MLLISLIILSAGIFIKFTLGFGIFQNDLKGMFLSSLPQNLLRKQSSVNVSLDGSKLNLGFDITEEDKPKFREFVNNWFGSNEEIKNLSFGLDENIIPILNPSLPIGLNLKISPKALEFRSQSIPSLQDALIKNDFEFATGSSVLSVKYFSPSKYQVGIENPDDLAFYATSSGVLTRSSNIEGLFKRLSKVATIELSVSSKNIAGKIVLK